MDLPMPDAPAVLATRSATAAVAARPGRAAAVWQALAPLLLSTVALLEIEWFNRTASLPHPWPPEKTQALLDACRDFAAAPAAWAISAALILGLVYLLAGILGRLRWAGAFVLILFLLLGIAHREKFQATREPILWWDLRFTIPVAMACLKLVPRVYFVIAGVLATSGITWWWRSGRKRCAARATLRQRIGWTCAGLVLLAGTITLLTHPPRALAAAIILPDGPSAWTAPLTYQQRGLTLCLAMQAAQPPQRPPANYSRETMDRIGREYQMPLAFPAPGEAPDVILWLSESFFDVGQLPGVRITPDPLANFRRIAAEGRQGSLLVPVFGGMTACTEYEILTGMSHCYTPGSLCEYREFVNRPMPTIPRLFAQNGYRTIAVSACVGSVFREPTIMPLLGFDEYFEDVPFAKQRGNWVSDASLARFVISTVESSSQPVFFLARSMQAHTPYTAGEYPQYDVKVEGPLPPPAAQTLRSYAQSIHEADLALRDLVDHFRRSKRNVVIVFFGDHLPPLPDVYEATGFLEPPGMPKAAAELRQRTTPLLLWTNSAVQLPALPAYPLSPPMMMSRLLGSMGVRHPFYTGMLGDIAGSFPAISTHVSVTAGGAASLEPPRSPLLADYAALCYDVLVGERHSTDSLFAPVPKK